MSRRRTRARRKASNGVVDIIDWDPIGDGSPPLSPHLTLSLDVAHKIIRNERARQRAALEDAPSTEFVGKDLFSQMPFDVILEIMGYLQSIDLISMSRTSHLFQGILHERSETVERIWKHGRRISWFPRCLEIMSGGEARWAVLLFRKHCEGCGALTKQRTDFYIRRNYCKECKLKNCIRRDIITKAYPTLDEEDLKLMPYTRMFRRRNKGRRKINYYFLKADIEEVIEQLDSYAEKTKTGAADAWTALEEYKEHRVKLVWEITSRVCRLEQ